MRNPDQTQARLAAEEIQALPYNRETDDASLYCDHIAAIIEKHFPAPAAVAEIAAIVDEYTPYADIIHAGHIDGRKIARIKDVLKRCATSPTTPAPAAEAGLTAEYSFDRYINGVLMAEGGRVTATCEAEARGIVASRFSVDAKPGEMDLTMFRLRSVRRLSPPTSAQGGQAK
jgi:hypothetical protein